MKSSICLLALIIGLAGCGRQPGSNNEELAQQGASQKRIDETARSDDALIAPAQPEIFIDAKPETLVVSWQATGDDHLTSLFQYNTATGEESLIQGDIPSDISTRN